MEKDETERDWTLLKETKRNWTRRHGAGWGSTGRNDAGQEETERAWTRPDPMERDGMGSEWAGEIVKK